MKISYAITLCNEYEEILRLVGRLQKLITRDDEIVILFDTPKVQPYLKSLLNYWSDLGLIKLCEDEFNNDFSKWKNKLTSECTGDYIFQIDADELPHDSLLASLPSLLNANSQFDAFLVPRINTVADIQKNDLLRWQWSIDEKGWINFPDYQTRIYRNSPSIRWVNQVHERLDGFQMLTKLPAEEEWSLYHPKNINKQRQQNNYYDSLLKDHHV
jgi:hypothetical protein